MINQRYIALALTTYMNSDALRTLCFNGKRKYLSLAAPQVEAIRDCDKF